MPYKDPEKRRAKTRANYAADPDKFKVRHKAWRDRNVDHCASYRQAYRGERGPAHRRDRYGLTPDDFNAMLAAQGGRCAICRKEPSGSGKTMATLRVDHDHGTGAVRALLCHRCNAGLGMFGDDSAMVFKAAMYLAQHGAKRESA
jgi:hypothetical protein